MAFDDVAADAYDRFMGRWSSPLAERLLDHLDPEPDARALDVGCGPGALTAPLVARLGPGRVSAVDPSPPFAAAAHERFPDVDVREAPAERMPFDDDAFDLSVASLVVQFMRDPVAGLVEMRRVTRPGGTVAATVWDHGTGRGPLTPVWKGARLTDPSARDESDLAGVREGDLAARFEQAGLVDVRPGELTVTLAFATFEEWWDPMTYGVGPVGDYLKRLDDAGREEVRESCRRLLPAPPFELSATAWLVTGRA